MQLFHRLQALRNSEFPKTCANCGRVYRSATDFFAQTQALRATHSGLKASRDDDESPIVEAFRNCLCGSTLMSEFGCRRDNSAEGETRRQLFGALLQQLVSLGMPQQQAIAALRQELGGGASPALRSLLRINDDPA